MKLRRHQMIQKKQLSKIDEEAHLRLLSLNRGGDGGTCVHGRKPQSRRFRFCEPLIFSVRKTSHISHFCRELIKVRQVLRAGEGGGSIQVAVALRLEEETRRPCYCFLLDCLGKLYAELIVKSLAACCCLTSVNAEEWTPAEIKVVLEVLVKRGPFFSP